ncbi:MAG: GNAT family N-acetyltransferase [Actinomycetes bacterium]
MTRDVHPRLLHRIEQYLDAVPRSSATAETFGPFTIFVAEVGWPFYARPTLDATDPIAAVDVTAVIDRQRDLGMAPSIEWVAETSPDLSTAARDAGLELLTHPLLVHHDPLAVPVPDGVRIRRLEADDDAVTGSRVVAGLGFATPGTERGSAGPAERDEALRGRSSSDDAYLRARVADGRTVVVVAEDEHGVLATGSHQPVDDVTEIVGVATLPDHRRRGLGAAIADTLVADAVRRGVQVVFLSAGSDDVARVYERVGFTRIGTAHVASPVSGVTHG